MTASDPLWGGEVRIAKILPDKTNWGKYFEIKDLSESRLIPEVSDEILDRALRGNCTPFMNCGVREPQGCLKKVSLPKDCGDKEGCISHDSNNCKLGHKNMPDCFAPMSTPILRPIIIAWLEGYYIVREEELS